MVGEHGVHVMSQKMIIPHDCLEILCNTRHSRKTDLLQITINIVKVLHVTWRFVTLLCDQNATEYIEYGYHHFSWWCSGSTVSIW